MTKLWHGGGRLRTLLLAYLALVAIILSLQIFPVTGEPLSHLGAPLWPGLLMHLLLFAIAIEALRGKISRWLVVVPAAVWLGGVAAWWIGIEASRTRNATQGPKLVLPVPAEHVHLSNTSYVGFALGRSLVSLYKLKSAYTITQRTIVRLGSGQDCLAKPASGSWPQWTTPFLKAANECIVVEQGEASPDGYDVWVETTVDDFGWEIFYNPARAGVSEIKIKARGKTPPFEARFEVRQETWPIMMLIPIIGCVHFDGQRNCIASMMRSMYLNEDSPDQHQTRVPWLDFNAYYIARALGLERRIVAGPPATVAK